MQLMMMDRNKSPETSGPLINKGITAKEVLVIDSEGQKLGSMSIWDARKLATESGLDLVEVSPTAKPPVCKIMDYGKLLYDQKKKLKNNDKGKGETKELRFGVSIDQHDLQIKARQAKTFIEKGWKVKVQVKFKGRENSHPEIGLSLLDTMMKMIGENLIKSSTPSREGRYINVLITPK